MRRAFLLTGRKCFIRSPAVQAWRPALRCLPFGELLEKSRVLHAERAVDPQTRIGPRANPVTVMQVRMTGVSVVYVGLVMTTAGAQRARPAGVAIVFGVDVAALQEIGLLRAIDAGGDIPHGV